MFTRKAETTHVDDSPLNRKSTFGGEPDASEMVTVGAWRKLSTTSSSTANTDVQDL